LPGLGGKAGGRAVHGDQLRLCFYLSCWFCGREGDGEAEERGVDMAGQKTPYPIPEPEKPETEPEKSEPEKPKP